MKKILTAFVAAIALASALAGVLEPAQKFVQASKNDDFDIYIDIGNMRKANGVVYFWVKTMYSESGREIIRRELPRRLREAKIEYGMDYFEYDTNTNLFRTSFCSVYDGDGKEIFREGSRKWREIEPDSLARLLIDTAVKEMASRESK